MSTNIYIQKTVILHIFTIFIRFGNSFLISDSNLKTVNNASEDKGFFWQLTDIHWDLNYTEKGIANEMCHEGNSQDPKDVGKFGNYFCDSPWALVNSTFQAMKSYNEHPNFILWTGDNAPHTEAAVFPVIFETLRNITDELLALFGDDVPIIPVLGNHDTFPKDDFPDNNEDFYKLYLEKGNWKNIIPSDEVANFKRGGYYKYKLNSNIWILVLNTNLYYAANVLGNGVEDPANQFAWMKKEFQTAKDADVKLFVTAHAPAGYWERLAQRPFFNETYNDKFVDILNEFGDTIIAQIYGHLHTDSFRIFGTSHDNLKSVAFIAPSVTPFYPTRLIGGTGINPSIRLYSYNSSVVLDYVQYNMNLTEANNMTEDGKVCDDGISDCEYNRNGLWDTYYRASEFFRVTSLSTDNLADVYAKLYSNDTFFQQYYRKNSAGFDQNYCNATCKRIYLCAIAHLKIDSVPKCVNQDYSNSSRSYIHSATESSYHILPEINSIENSFSFNSLMAATVTLTAAISAVILVIGVMLIVISVRRKRILNSGSKLSEFEWVSRRNGYKPLSVNE